jgi:hypothetical protein
MHFRKTWRVLSPSGEVRQQGAVLSTRRSMPDTYCSQIALTVVAAMRAICIAEIF